MDNEFNLQNKLLQKILSKIDKNEWLDLTKEMIKTGQPSSGNPLDPDILTCEEEPFALFVAGKLEAMGFEVTKYESQPRRPNIVGVLKGSEGKKSLMINDHLDTYPAVEPFKWDKCNKNPFNATVHGDWLYGRGTSDTRGNLSAALLAVKSLIDTGIKFKDDLICCFTVDEEKDGPHGSIYLTQTIGITADYSITAEPTAWGGESKHWGMNISTANSGHCLCSIKISGIKSHIWRPDTGVNAISVAAEVIPYLDKMLFTHQKTTLMGHTPPCISVVKINGGLPGEMQFSPDECEIILAVVGIVPGMTIESVIKDINDNLIGLIGGKNNVVFEVNQVPGSLFVSATDPVLEKEEPVKSLSECYELIMGEKPGINRKNAFNDTIRFREKGYNAVTFGPGEDGWSPVNESISIKKSEASIKIYALTILKILGVDYEQSNIR